MTDKIGIPRGLFYYKYNPFFMGLLTELSYEVVTSPPTNKGILAGGVRAANSETCLPTKTFIGHCLWLAQAGVGRVLIPRVVSTRRRCYSCPKFLGLPDVAKVAIDKHGANPAPEVLTCTVDFTKGKGWLEAAVELGRYLGREQHEVRRAAREALRLQERLQNLVTRRGMRPPEAMERVLGTGGDVVKKQAYPNSQKKLTVALIGHPYNVYDKYTSLGLLEHLEDLGLEVLTADAVLPEMAYEKAGCLEKPMFWTFGYELLGAALFFAEHEIDGIIFLSVFGCGPDSFVEDITARRVAKQRSIPTLFLNIDEHTAEAGLLTRIEAFTDMLRWRLAQ